MGVARAVTAAGALGVGLLCLGACGVTWSSHQYEDNTPVPQKITKVRVTGAGDLHVKVGATSVHRVVHYAENDPGKNTWQVQGDTLVVDNCHHVDCSVDYDLVVPEGTTITGEVGSSSVEVDGLAKVNLQAHSGDVVVRDVPGPVNVAADSGNVTVSDAGDTVAVNASSGDVNLTNVTGAVTARASSGNVTAAAVHGPVDVQASSGDISVQLAANQNIKAQAGSGNVDITVPQGQYAVHTDSGSGEVDSAVPDVGTGQFLLDLQAGSGDISVNYA